MSAILNSGERPMPTTSTWVRRISSNIARPARGNAHVLSTSRLSRDRTPDVSRAREGARLTPDRAARIRIVDVAAPSSEHKKNT